MEDNREKTNSISEFLGKYGAYVIVTLCIVAAAIVSLIVFPSEEKKDEAAIPTPAPIRAINTAEPVSEPVTASRDERISDVLDPVTGKPTENVRQAAKTGDADSTPVPDFTPAPDDGQKTDELLNPPVSGEIIWDFAANELIYSATLDQWTTHCGVDIACRQGDTVRCVAAGTVEKVYEDDAYGVTVVIAHKNGHKTVYSSLASDEKLVKAGATVKANDVIGTCGNTSQFECADKSHIHFEYHVNGKPVNPHKYVRFVSDN